MASLNGVPVPCAETKSTAAGDDGRHRPARRSIGADHAAALAIGGRHVHGVGRGAGSEHARTHARAAAGRVRRFLDHQDGGALAQDEAAPVAVERTRNRRRSHAGS